MCCGYCYWLFDVVVWDEEEMKNEVRCCSAQGLNTNIK